MSKIEIKPTVQERFAAMLHKALNELEKDGYCFIDLTPNGGYIFCNQHYAEIRLGRSRELEIGMTFLRKED